MSLEKKMPNVSHYAETTPPVSVPVGYVAFYAEDNTLKVKNETGVVIDLANGGVSLSTGIYLWETPCLAINGDATKVDVSAGRGYIVNYHDDPENPTETRITWTAQTVTIAAVASIGITYLLVDSLGAVSQQTTDPTPEQRREKIFLGRAVHTAGTGFVNQVLATPDVITNPANQLHELMDILGIINQNVRVINNDANLKLDLVGGNILARGAGYRLNRANPNEVTIASASPMSFAYITQVAGSTGSTITDIVAGSYDLAGVITAIPGSILRATNQRIYVFPSGAVRIAYGQSWYDNISSAIQAIGTEGFTINPNVVGNAVLVAILTITKGCTNLADTGTSRILPASRFGETAVGGSGVSTSTLQQAYTNSTDGKITTDSSRLAVDIQGGTGSNTDKSLQLLNNAASVTAAWDANGLQTGTSISHSANTITYGTLTTKTLSSDTATIGTDRNVQITSQTGTSDDLSTISASPTPTAWSSLLISATSGHTITVKHGVGNIYLTSLKDFILEETHPLLLRYNDSGNWVEDTDTHAAKVETLTGKTISHSANVVTMGAYATVTLSGDAAALGVNRNIRISAETGVTDDLSQITASPSATVGEMVHLHATNGHTITIKHGVNNIYLRSGADYVLLVTFPTVLKYNDSGNWIQVNG